MGEKVIEIKNVKKTYKLYEKPSDRLRETMSLSHKQYHTDHYALDCINFDIYKGECVGIIGTNGSGKSTLLKIVTGVLNPTEGEVRVEGKISALLELGAGFNQEYTGIQNIYLSGMMAGFTEKEMEQRVDSIIEFAEIGKFIDQPVKTYSSGMFARLAFAVAINVEPDILIVDEALSVGDIFFQSKCYHKFEEFKAAGKTILFVSHDMGSIIKYCDRSLLIHQGKQIMEGKSKEVVDVYKKILVNQYNPDEKEESDVIEKNTKESGDWKEQMIINPNAVTYGDGKAEIIDFAVVDEKGLINSNVYKETECTIKMKVRFYETVENPIFAYTIKDIKGTEITGTNTMLENCNIETAKAGQEIKVSFKQKMVLQGAQYMLSFGCTGYENGEFVVHSRIYDACNLQVISDRNTIGVVDLNAEVLYE